LRRKWDFWPGSFSSAGDDHFHNNGAGGGDIGWGGGENEGRGSSGGYAGATDVAAASAVFVERNMGDFTMTSVVRSIPSLLVSRSNGLEARV
jgi:hypothetical protein